MIIPQAAAVILCTCYCSWKGRFSILVKRVAAITLGCAKNQVDTEYMLGMLPESDYEIVAKPEEADAVVINTCCFI